MPLYKEKSINTKILSYSYGGGNTVIVIARAVIYDAIIRKRIDSLVAARRYHRKVAIKIYWHVFPNVGGRCKIATLDSSLFTILLRDWSTYLSMYFIVRVHTTVVWKSSTKRRKRIYIYFYFRIKLFIREKTLLKIKSINLIFYF